MDKEAASIITIRGPRENDRSFILATWLRGLYYGNPWFREIEKDVFMYHYHSIVSGVLSHPTTIVSLAALKEDQDIILGYSVLTPPNIIHWVFVKEAWRKLGISKKLVPIDADITTHLTVLGKRLKPKNMTFNPFLL